MEKNGGSKGSLMVESLVMLGLIATLTPILYKHVSERREDLENINEANTLLLLKKSTEEYISEHKDSLNVGAVTVTPSELGLDIDGYLIGIRKEDDGTINAMVACNTPGSDMKAAKVASLLGVSAGIYSAQDEEKAWGINGVWAEEVANYGLEDLPSGVPVVTTTYDVVDEAVLNITQIIAELEENELKSKKLEAEQFCLNNPDIPEEERCISEWNIASFNPIEVISQCNADKSAGVTDSTACAKGWEKNLNRSCSDIAIKYKGAGFNASSGIYAITTGENTQVERACYFVNGVLPSNAQLIEAVKTDAIARRYDWENSKVTASCAKIIASWSSAPTALYSFVTGESSYNANQPCVFTGSRVATGAEVITQCNSGGGSSVACRYGWNNNINRSCARVVASNTSAATGWYNITTSSSATSTPCVFVSGRVATNAEVISQCNSGGGSSVACRYGWNNNINRSCERVIASNTSAGSGWYQITTSSSSSSQPCYFVGSRVATAAETIAQCNNSTTSSDMNSSVSCRYGYVRGYNTSCDIVVSNYSSGKGITNSITTSGGGSRECCQCSVPCSQIGTVSGGECRDINGWGWVRSTGAKTYWEAQTFCSNLGMTLKSRAAIQSAGLWNTGSNPFSVAYWHWSTDAYSGCDCGWLVDLGTSATAWVYRNNGYGNLYALCGPAL